MHNRNNIPRAGHGFMAACFSVPPTSPDCIVVIFSATDGLRVSIHNVALEQLWHTLRLGVDWHV